MGRSEAWGTIRRLAAQMHGYRCYICRIPTAATAEHVQARANDGSNHLDNIRLACPYCNSKKGKRNLEEFLASRDWELPHPPDLEQTVTEMLAARFGWGRGRSGIVSTGSTNAKLKLEGGDAFVLVRADKRDPWMTIRLGSADHPRVTRYAYDFLARHFTPPKPRRRRPPKSAFAKRR